MQVSSDSRAVEAGAVQSEDRQSADSLEESETPLPSVGLLLQVIAEHK
ncbi:hypothetical protein TGGT1_212960A, partial [Toxoplasma gondii GT1]